MSEDRHRALRQDSAVVHAGRATDPTTGAIVPPIHLATTFARDEAGELLGDFLYGRYTNPNRQALETCLAELEGAAAGAAFASGSAAATAVMQSLESGDRILVGDDFYFGIRKLLLLFGRRSGVQVDVVDLADPVATEAALSGGAVRLVYCETPSNPLMKVADLARLAERAHHHGALLLVDNTVATPLLQRPLALGADLVLHATTKSLAGHSDVLGGALLARESTLPLWERIVEIQRLAGAVPSPFDCWLTLRGIATLAVRLRAAVDNAERLAEHLAAHPAVERVLYPGLDSHPGHAIATRQMRRPGSLLSILVREGEPGARRFMAGLRVFTRATSLGGVHSLAEHRIVVEGPTTTTPVNLVRLSIGIEDVDDLREDLEEALGRVRA